MSIRKIKRRVVPRMRHAVFLNALTAEWAVMTSAVDSLLSEFETLNDMLLDLAPKAAP